MFNETRVPDMPRVRTAEEWQVEASAIRKQVLDRVVFRGGAADWRDTPLRVKWGKTIEDLRKRSNIEAVKEVKRAMKLISKPQFKSGA